MVRRIVEEETASSPTIVERDDSWVGRTLVALVVVVLLVIATVWLVRTVGDDGTSPGNVIQNTDTNDQPADQDPLPTST